MLKSIYIYCNSHKFVIPNTGEVNCDINILDDVTVKFITTIDPY